VHASRWQTRLEAAGESLPKWQPSARSRLLTRLASIFGTKSVLPLLERFEGGDADMYAAEPAAQDFSIEERSHGLIFAGLRGKRNPEPFQIADQETRHRGAGGGSLRAAVFGVNDGLVSNLSLIMGVAGADAGHQSILVAGVAGLLAGAFSMATGEYVSMRTQRELLERELDLERAELEENPAEEQQELALIYRAKGLSPEEADTVSKRLMSDKSTALDTLAREELGLHPRDLGSPWGAATSSFVAFAAGALLPLIPYVLATGSSALVISGVVSGCALALVGVSTALLTGRSLLFSAFRMVALGALATAVTFGIGRMLGVAMAG
jgi:VIT1/CCC1 family predicted Fe2+/Mn2+ transporter